MLDIKVFSDLICGHGELYAGMALLENAAFIDKTRFEIAVQSSSMPYKND